MFNPERPPRAEQRQTNNLMATNIKNCSLPARQQLKASTCTSSTDNDYHPKEGDALQQIGSKAAAENWVRIETRAGVGKITSGVCFWCGS